MYPITKSQYETANRLGLEIFSSDKPKYKLDVYKDGDYITSIGAKSYKDFYIYFKENPELAYNRRQAYYNRHKKNILNGGRGLLSWLLLWNGL